MAREAPKGFTLIELLIVVAIIAILAAIAIPNFLEAQVRSKVSRVRTDMRSLTVAMEAYFVDWNGYPRHRDFTAWPIPPSDPRWFAALTTPVAYITSMPTDPFSNPSSQGKPSVPAGNYFHYDPLQNSWTTGAGAVYPYDWMPSWWGPWPGFVAEMVARGFWYVLWSPGPDGLHEFADNTRGVGAFYDPTNGTVSRGDIVRLGPGGEDFARPARY